MTDIQLQCTPGPGQFGGYSVFITDDHIRAIAKRAKEMGLLPSVVKESLTVQPAAPADDEATIEALIAIDPMIQRFRLAVPIYHAIRRGEVPGLTTSDANGAFRVADAFVKERDTLKVEVERLRAESSNHAADAETVRRERDALMTQVDRLRGDILSLTSAEWGELLAVKAERDTLKAEVALLGSELKHARDTVVDLDAEVDRLRAELAERNHAKYFSTIRKEVLACIDNGEIPGYCTIPERDAAIARAEKLDSELGAHKASRIAYASEFDGDVGSIHQNIRAMKKDLGAAHAAHAEAMELLERWREKSHPMNFGRSISEDTRAYLAKYGKDASK